METMIEMNVNGERHVRELIHRTLRVREHKKNVRVRLFQGFMHSPLDRCWLGVEGWLFYVVNAVRYVCIRHSDVCLINNQHCKPTHPTRSDSINSVRNGVHACVYVTGRRTRRVSSHSTTTGGMCRRVHFSYSCTPSMLAWKWTYACMRLRIKDNFRARFFITIPRIYLLYKYVYVYWCLFSCWRVHFHFYPLPITPACGHKRQHRHHIPHHTTPSHTFESAIGERVCLQNSKHKRDTRHHSTALPTNSGYSQTV